MKKAGVKTFAWFVIALICFIIIRFFDRELSGMENIIIAEFRGEYSSWHHELVNNYIDMVRGIQETGFYYDYEGSLVAAEGPRSSTVKNILVCMVDQNYIRFDPIKMIRGRFIWNSDIENRNKYIVIEKSMAVELFSSTDCIGRDVKLNGDTYTIIGVYQERNPLVSTLSATSKGRVFVPYYFAALVPDEVMNVQGRHLFLVRSRKNIAGVIVNSVEKNLEGILKTTVSVENVDIKARQCRQKIKFTYFIVLCIALIYLVKHIVPIVRDIYSRFRDRMEDYYFPEAVQKYWAQLIGLILVISVLAALFYLVLTRYSPELIIDPELIPSRLTNTGEIVSKLKDYFIRVNTQQIIVSRFNAFIAHSDEIIHYLCLLLIISSWRMIHILSIVSKVSWNVVQFAKVWDKRV